MDRIEKLQNIANYARYLIIKTLVNSGLGHPGGSLSSIDVMTALYFDIMNIDLSNPDNDERDRFILSKGHSSLGLYTVLNLKGFIRFPDQITLYAGSKWTDVPCTVYGGWIPGAVIRSHMVDGIPAR
mgnify:CR=1 FL=1